MRSLVIILLMLPLTAFSASRFPQPEFDSNYQIPTQTQPNPPPAMNEYIDLVVLAAALLMAAHLVLQKRSRRGIFWLSVFCLAYFGFYRRGCVCSVGSIQNVVNAFTDPNYTVPLTVLGFFLLPLIATLLFGRVFCAAVCPLGAIQDIVAIKPGPVPRPIALVLGLIPYVYIGLAVMLAATGAGYFICRFDPFVGFFRLSGSPTMLVLGGCLLLAGIIAARPYCRFLCPYSVLLNLTSRFSRKHATITPGECIQCRLCEGSCPFDAIRKPTDKGGETEAREVGKHRLAIFLLLTPVMITLGAFLGSLLQTPLSKLHPDVQLAQQISAEESGALAGTTLMSEAFRSTGEPISEAYDRGQTARRKIGVGSRILGAFLGLVIAMKLIGLSITRSRTDYEPDRAECLSCARCFEYCPVERSMKKDGVTIEEIKKA